VRRTALFVALAAVAGCAHGGFGAGNFDRELQSAKADRQIVLVEFYATWCVPCKAFDRDILAHAAVGRALSEVRFLRYDVDDPASRPVYRGVVGKAGIHVPVFVALDGDGHIVGQQNGAPTEVEDFIAFVDEVAAAGGTEAALLERVRSDPGPRTWMRLARWYRARDRDKEAVAWYDRVIAAPDAGDELRADADWERGPLVRKGGKRDARAPLAFVRAHPGSRKARVALDMIAVLSDLSADEVAGALRACFAAQRGKPLGMTDLVYRALAAHQYELALEFAQAALRARADVESYAALAEAAYYRGDAATAVAMAQRGAARGSKEAEALHDDIARYKRADGSPSQIVELLRFSGIRALADFYGDAK